MQIVSWNVNGIRAVHRKGFGDWLAKTDAEIIGLQETRAELEQFPKEVRQTEDWHLAAVSAERKGYSGVAILSRREPDGVETSLASEAFDVEARFQRARFGRLQVVNAYFPNGSGRDRDLSRIPYKLDFYRRVFDLLEDDRAAGEPILVMGDFNTAHREIDLARPKQNVETSGFRPEEREELDRWLREGWVDTFREFEKGGDIYTWWSQRKGVRERNVGWRIDYVLASPGAMEYVEAAEIHTDVMGSDHCPVSVTVNRGILG